VSPAKNGWTDRDAVQDVDSGGPKEPRIRWDPDSHAGRGNFENEKGRAQDMPWHIWVRRSIYWKLLSRRQNRYCADGYWWGALDRFALWRNLANTVEPAVCGGDAALY